VLIASSYLVEYCTGKQSRHPTLSHFVPHDTSVFLSYAISPFCPTSADGPQFDPEIAP